MNINLKLLNSEELKGFHGGKQECNKPGDTLACGKEWKIIYCIWGEAICPGDFTYSCGPIAGVSITGCEVETPFTIKPHL